MTKAIVMICGAGVVFLALILPNHPNTMVWGALNRFPLELPMILCGLLALPRIRGLPALIAGLLTMAIFIKLADFGMFTAYNRTFNPILDSFLIGAGISLLSDSIGGLLTVVAIALAVIALILIFFALLHGLRAWARVVLPKAARVAAAVAAVIFGAWTVADAGHHLQYWRFEQSPPGTAWTSRLTFKRMVDMRATAQDLAQFRASAAEDPFRDQTGLLDQIGARDVIVIYIESYGRTSFENPLYMDTHLSTLRAAETALTDAGFAIRSGWLTSPTQGGQSWLAHGALSSGLWTTNKGRYSAMLASGKKTLFHIAQEAGYRTATIMPAITKPWPESSAMGFEVIYPAAAIPYAGPPFNWVTVPDQYTLSVYEDMLGDDPRPDFIQIALISSHAPWVPVLPILPVDQLGDGSVYQQWDGIGPTPREVWKDHDKVRDQYRQSVDYSLEVAFAHIASLEDAPLVIVVGDHQPAGFVSQIESLDVAMHIIGPPEVLAEIDAWSWTPGLIPDPNLAALRMDGFRDAFLRAFTSAPELGMAN